MGSSGLHSETAAIIDLLQRARHAHREDPTTAPALLLAAVNKAVKAVAPDVEPWETVKRLTKEGDGWSLEAGYTGIAMVSTRTAATRAHFRSMKSRTRTTTWKSRRVS